MRTYIEKKEKLKSYSCYYLSDLHVVNILPTITLLLYVYSHGAVGVPCVIKYHHKHHIITNQYLLHMLIWSGGINKTTYSIDPLQQLYMVTIPGNIIFLSDSESFSFVLCSESCKKGTT